MRRYLKIFIAVLLILLVAVAFYYFYSMRAKRDPVQAVIVDVGKLIVLPENEIPTVATVTDVEQLRGQPFFSSAEVGDKVLIYTEARKAFLYRPSIKKLVEVSLIATNSVNFNSTE